MPTTQQQKTKPSAKQSKATPVKRLVKQPLSKTKGNAFIRLEAGFIGKTESITAEVVVKGKYVTKKELEQLKQEFIIALEELNVFVK